MDSNKSVLQINLCELNYNSGKAVGGSIVVFDEIVRLKKKLRKTETDWPGTEPIQRD